MKSYVYVVSIRNRWGQIFDLIRLFHNKQDAIDFLEDQSFSHKFDDEYIKMHDGEEVLGTIRLYEVEGEQQ